MKIKKIFIALVMFIIISSLSACNRNTSNELTDYKYIANTEIQDYVETKAQADYTAEDWAVICELVTTGKTAINAATDKADMDTIIDTTKGAIDDIPKKEITPITITDFEHLSDEELEYVSKNYNKYHINIGYINDKYYGRIVNSSTSAENALEVVTEHFTDNRYSFSTNNVVEVRLDIETKLFYGVYVKWEHNSSGQLSYYDEYVVSFKKDLYDCKVKKLITDSEYSIFKTKNIEYIKQIMDYKYYSRIYNIYGSKLLYSEVVETENYFVYRTYGIRVVGGDWGLQDEISLIRIVWAIEKSIGEMVLSSNDTMKIIYVDGKFTHYTR